MQKEPSTKTIYEPIEVIQNSNYRALLSELKALIAQVKANTHNP